MKVMNILGNNPVAQAIGSVVKNVIVKGIGGICKQIHDLISKKDSAKQPLLGQVGGIAAAPSSNLHTLPQQFNQSIVDLGRLVDFDEFNQPMGEHVSFHINHLGAPSVPLNG